MNMKLGSNAKRFSTKLLAMLICVTLIVQMFWSGDVALGASPYYFRGYDAQNITGGTFSTSGATVNSSGSLITMTDAVKGEAIGFVALDEVGYDISTSIDLGSLEIDFSTTTVVSQEGVNSVDNDVPTVRIDFCRSNYSTVISSVNLAKPDNAVSGSVALTSNVSIPVGTRSVIIYLYGANTSGENTVRFENTSFIIHDAAAPACSVDYNHNWTNQPVTVTVSASDSDSGLEGVYKNGVKMTPPYTFTVTSNTTFSVYSKDYAGKTSATQNISITNIDTTAPAAPASLILSHTDWTNTDVSVTVPALGTPSGAPERYIYRLDGGAWADLPAGYAITGNGQHTIDVAVIDAAGNVSSAVSGTAKIDKLEPSIDRVDTAISSGSVTVTVTASDVGLSGLAALKYAEGSHDAAFFQAGGGTDIVGGTFTVAAGGVFTIWAADNAGNYDISEDELNTAPTIAHTEDFEMDEDVPQTIVLDIADAETALNDLIVTAQASDTDIISEVHINQDGDQISIDIIPEANMSGGPVTITIKVRDGREQEVTDTFLVTVRPVNDDPVAMDDEGIATDEDTSIKINVLGNDYDTADGDTLTITDAGTPQHGTAVIAGGQIRYTPSSDYNGADQFTYTISDGHGGTASATVFISAVATNDPPTAIADTAKVDEDSSVLIDVVANDTDIDMTSTDTEVLALYSVSNGAHGTAVMEDGKVRYTPAADYFGKDTFSYVVIDSGGLTCIGTVTVTVKGMEDPPRFVDLNTEYSIDEDSVGAEITFSVSDAETEAASLMLQAVSLDETQKLLKSSGITITGLGDSDGLVTLHLTPQVNAFGDVTVSLTLGDGFTAVTQTFTLHIINVNDAPSAKNDTISYAEDSGAVTIETASLIANDTDIDGDTLSFAGILSTTSVGELVQVDEDTWQYTPPADYDGEDSFTYTVSDGHGGTAVGTCVLKATASNDAPVITIPDGSFSTNEDTASEGITFTVSDEETDAEDLIVRAASNDTDMIADAGISVVNNGDGTCTLTVTPAQDAYGDATITITVSDGAASSSKTLTFTINPTPDAPVAVNDKIYVSLSGRRTFAVLCNDHDADGDALTVVPDSWLPHSLNGQLTFNDAAQTFTYRSANGEVGTGTFTYRVTDGENISEPATVTLTINSMTHAPEISMIASQRIVEDTGTDLIPVTVTDEDLGDTATLTVASSNTALLPVDYDNNVLITDLGGGSFTLQLVPAANKSGTSYITVTATDKTGKTAVTGFLLTVYPYNDPPVAMNDTFTIDEDGSATLMLLANDTDPEGDTLWLNGISWPSHGYVYSNGVSYIYVPYANWNGTETLTYSITDGQATDTATVTINVTPVNDAPVNYSNWVEVPNVIGQGAQVNVLAGDYDPDGDTVRLYQIISGPSYGSAVMDAETGKITYTRTSVSPNANGADQLTYRIIDRDTATGDYLYADAVLYIGVEFNSSLYAYHSYVYCFEDDPAFTFDLSIHNPNNVDYTLTIDGTTSLGALEVVDRDTVRFTPAANQYGGVWIDYTVAGGGESATGSFYLRVYPINDAPVIDSAPETASCDEDSSGADFTVTFHDDDCLDENLRFYAYAHNPNSASPVVLTMDITVDRETGEALVNARPVANANGTVDIVVGVTDGIAWTERTIHMTVNPVDDAPLPLPVSRTLYEDMEVTIPAVTPDSEVDGDSLTVSIEDGDGPAHGTAVVNPDGTITYTPGADYYGTDSLVFTVTDDTEASLFATQIATFTILPVNDQPEISNLNYYQTTREDTPVDVTLTVADVDNILTASSCYTLTSDNQALIPDGSISISHVTGTAMKISLTPALNAYGTAIITVVASDGELTAEAQFKLTVQPINDVPVAADDAAGGDETVGAAAGTTSVTIDLTDNDTDVEPGTLKVIRITNVSVGTVKNNGDGTVTYSVDGDYNGTATFDYTVMDAGGATDTATVTVTISAQNDPPRAGNDSASTSEDNDVTIAVLDNDSDPEGDTLAIAEVSEPAHGTAITSGTDIVYSPNDDYNGTDSFTYTVSDGNGGTDTAGVTVAVSAVNDAPEIAKYPADAGDWTMSEDTTEAFTFVVSDAETAAVNLIITIDSQDKTIITNPGIVLSTNAEGQKVITVTPLENQSGVVPVEFRVSDGVNTTTVTWNITITAVNDAPEITVTDFSTPEDTSFPGRATATDAEDNILTFSPGLAPAHGSVIINADGTFTYTPDHDYVGGDIFGIYVSDGQTEHNLDYGLVHVTVTPVNDKPDAADDTASTAEDTAVVIDVTANDTDVDLPGDTLTVISVSAPAHGTAAAVEGGIRYTPAANWSGTDTFTYTIADSDNERDTATVTVTVSPVNDDPVAQDDALAETDEDMPVTISVAGNDTDPDIAYGDTITVVSVGTPEHGTVVVAEGGIRYTPEANWYGVDTFSYTIEDGEGRADTAQVTVTVHSVNDDPYFVTNPAGMSLTEDGANGSSGFTVGDIETPAASLTVTLISSSNTTLVDSGDVSISSGTDGNRTVAVNPNDNRNGTANIKLRVSDGEDYAEYTFTVTVAAVNDAPSAQNDSAATNENTAKTINVMSNDDVDTAAGNEGDTLTLLTVTNGTYGTVAIVNNEAVYTPDANRPDTANYTDTFTYTMKDASGATSGATVTVTVTPVNDAPIITDPITGVPNVQEDSATGTGEIAFTVTDEEDDDDTLSVTVACSNTALFPLANITVNNPEGGDGSERTVQAIPAPNAFGTANITLTAHDSNGATDSVTFSVTVDAVDDTPTGCNDSFGVWEDLETQLDVLDNDDPDFVTNPEQLVIIAVSTPSHGTARVSTDGKFVFYKTAQDSNEDDEFTYTVHDAFGNQDYTFTVNISVVPVNDAPVVTLPDGTSYSTYEGIAVSDIPFTVTDVDNDIDTEVTLSASSTNPILVLNGLHIDDGTGSSRTMDVQPFRKWNGSTTITIRANDGEDVGSASFTFIVNTVNEAPVAVDDTLTVPEDALTFLDVLDNDTDGDMETNPDVEHIVVDSVTDEDPNAAITVAADGSGVNIQPNANYNGPVTFTYVIADAAGATSNTATVTVTVNQVNDAPVADDETATTDEDTAVTVDVLDGDTDIDQTAGLNAHPEAEVLSISLTGAAGPSHGSVSVVDGKIVYMPAADYNGPDSFEYFVTDGEAQDKGLVNITVTQVNDNPVAVTDTDSTPEDVAKRIDVLGNDTDVDTNESLNLGTLYSRNFAVSLTGATTAPSHGSVLVVAGEILYTPDVNWYGTDSFTYFIYDGYGGKTEGTVNVTVTSVNDAPVFDTNPADMYLTEDASNGSSSFTVSDVETSAANLNVTVESSSNPTLVGTGDVTVTNNGEGYRTVVVNPKNNQNGTTNIKLRVTDVDGGYREYTFTVMVASVNDAPVGSDASGTINEDTGYTVAWTGLTSDVDIATNADSIGVAITTQATHGTAVVSGNNITYTPSANWNGVDSFVYTVTDSAGATDTGTITVTVNQVNDAPVADDETATTDEDTAVTIDVLNGDTDIDQTAGLNAHPEAEVLSISLTGAAGPSHGSVSVVDGKIVYTPAANYNGSDSFEYFVTDGEAKDKGLVSITVTQVNDNPVADSDSATAPEDTAVTIDVLDGDTDVDTNVALNQGTLHYTSAFSISLDGTTRQPAHGDIEVVSGQIKYTPDANWYGADTFTYWILDGHGGSVEGTVNVTVTSENDLPVFDTNPEDMELTEDGADGSSSFTVSDVETAGEDLAVTVVSSSNPALVRTSDVTVTSGTDGNRTVVVDPSNNQNGTADITLRVTDGDDGYREYTFTVTVAAVNDNPVGNDASGTINEDTSYTVAWTGITSDVDIATNADSIGVTVTTQAAHGTAVISGSNIVYTPNANWNGVDSFVYTVTDSAGATDTGTVTVTVNQVNDAPVADDEPDVTTNEDTPVTIDVLNGDTDIDQTAGLNAHPEAEVLSISLTGAAAPAHGSVSVVDGQIVYTPDTDYNGPDSFEYFVTDGEAQDKGVVTMTVGQVNDNPVANADSATTPEDTDVTIDVLNNDTDVDTGDMLNQGTQHSRDSFSISLEGITTQPAHGDIEVVSGEVVYTPDANWYGEDSFTYFILDGHGGSAEGTVTVTVNSANDLPEFTTNPANMNLTEDGTDGSSSFSVSDVETAGEDLAVTVVSSSNTALVAETDVTVTEDGDGARTVVVNPRDNQNGTADITLRVTDGNDDYREYTFTVTVAAVNDNPVGNDASGTINEDTSYTVAWTGLTSDVDIATNADSIGVTVTTQALHGTAVVSGNNIVYTPSANWNGVDSFVYTVTDSAGATDTGTITVTVNQVNDAPVADDETATTNEDTAVTVDVLNGDTDIDQNVSLNAHPEAEVLSISLTGAAGPAHGSVSVVDGKIVYTPDANYNGPDSFEYFVMDGEAQDKGLVTVTVGQVNDNPVANADSATTPEDTDVTIDVLNNDTDVDTGSTLNQGTQHSRDDFSISLEDTDAPEHGDVSVVGGEIVYTPDDNWYGEDSFTYFILDGHGGSDEGTVTVTVGGDNDAPVANNDSVSADEDHTATVNVLDNDTDADPGDTLTFVSFLGDTASLPGTLEGTAAGVVTFVPDDNWNGSFTVQYQMRDADGETDEATITITINAVNDAPEAEDFSTATDEDTAKGIDISAYISDVDIATNDDSLTVTVEAGDGPAHGSVAVTDTTITYTPAANWNGTDSFTYTVTDEAGASDTGVITVMVAAVNDAPVADDEAAATDEDTVVTVDVLDGDTDIDTDTALNASPQAAVTISSVGDPAHGSTEVVDGQIVYTPDTDYNGSDSFTYVVTDGELSDTGTVTITIRPVNDNPEAADDAATTNDEERVTIDALANDTDVDTDAALNADPDSAGDFTITAVSTPANGTAVINGGKIDYTPDDTFSGEDSFTYTMSDGQGGSATATVTVTVLSVNDPPATPVVHTPVDGERYGGESTILVTWTGFDIDGDVLGYTLEYYDGSAWHVVQSGLTETEYEFEIPETLTSITDLQFRVNASDAEFTSDYGYSGTVEVDKDIPTNIVVTMTTADGRPYVAGTWTNQTVTVTAVSVSDASEVVFSYSIEDKAFSVADNRVVTSGVHTVYIRATDEFGNVSEFGGYLVRIDKQVPAQPQVGVSIEGANAVLSFTLGSDPGSSGNSYLVMPDGSRVVAGTGLTWKAAKNGTYTFKLYDVAGNVTTFTVTVNQIDESAPIIACDSGGYAIGSTTEEMITAALSFTDSESVITAKGYALSDSPSYSGAYKSYTGAIEITQPGTYYIHAYARNAFGLTTYQTFGPFIVAAVENPDTGEEPQGDVTVDAGDVGENVQVRTPGGDWTDKLTLENVEPGTYIIEVMDEDGNITTMEITITDEQIASGQWKPGETGGIGWYVWAVLALALLLLLLLIFWRNVKVTMYPEDGGRPLRNVRRLRRKQDEVIVTVAASAVRGSAYGRVTLGKAFTERMRGRTLVVMQDDAQVLKVQVPKDAQGRFEATIERWNSN